MRSSHLQATPNMELYIRNSAGEGYFKSAKQMEGNRARAIFRIGYYLHFRRRQQIGQRGPQELWIVAAETERTVAFGAKQPAHAAGDMAVVDAEDARSLAA